MGMSGKFDGLRPPQKFISGLYHQGSDYDEAGNRIDGICFHCKEWDAELVDGFCRDEECKDSRLAKKVEEGDAIRISTDVINPKGRVGTAIERGKTGYFIRRKK